MEDNLTVMTLCADFEAAESATDEARRLAERDRDYYDEKQLTPDERAALELRGQPPVVFNRIKRKVNALMGLEKQTRKDPKAFPRNPADEQAARAATDVLRYVVEDSRWDDKRSECARELAIEGTCAVMVGVKRTKAGIDPDIRRISWDRLYYDHHSGDFDFSDAKFVGTVVWMDLDDAQAKYPDAGDALLETWQQASGSETYDDRPKHSTWADYNRRRIRLCEHYYQDTEGWKFCIFTKGGFVVEPQPSPYHGEDGEPECPIKAVSLYVDRDNNRYGEVRTMISPQDAINKRESKALHLISSRQVRVSPNVATSPDTVRKELARPDGVFVGEVGDVEILPTNDMAAGNFQMLQDAKAEIDLLGPNAAMQGKNEAGMSGRAILAQQQGGMTESATYLDRIKTLSLAVYRAVWCRVRQYWQEERWVRVTDDESNVRFTGINRQLTLRDAMEEALQDRSRIKLIADAVPDLAAALQAAMQGDEQAKAIIAQVLQSPNAMMVIANDNMVGELDVDIMVDEGMDTPTVQAEQFDTIVKMIPALGPIAQDPRIIKFVVEASSLRGKEKLIALLEPQEGEGGPSPQDMMQQQAAMAQQQAQFEASVELEKAKIAAQADIERAQIAAATDIEVAQIKAAADDEIKGRQAMVDAMKSGYQAGAAA